MMRLRGWKIRCGNLREAGNEYSFIITAISEFYFRCQKIKHPQLNIMCNVRHFLFRVKQMFENSEIDAVAYLIMSGLKIFS